MLFQTSISTSLFESLKGYMRLDEDDARRLAELLPTLRPHVGPIVDEFYERVMDNPGTRRILDDPKRVERLTRTLRAWLVEVFSGPYDREYYERRLKIGLVHVRIGLPESYVFGAMNQIRTRVEEVVLTELDLPAAALHRRLRAVHKVLDLDLALLGGAYHVADKYRDLVELSPDLILTVGADDTIHEANATAARALGGEPFDFPGRRLEELVVPEDRDTYRHQRERVLEHGDGSAELRLQALDGRMLHVDVWCACRRDVLTDALIDVQYYLSDVTAQRDAERQLQWERDFSTAVLDTVGALVVVLDVDGRIVRFNEACRRVTGFAAEEVLGQPVWDLFLLDDERGRARSVFEEIRAGRFPNQHENDWRTKDGGRRTISWSNTALTNDAGEVEYVIGTGLDVTERHRLNQRLLDQESLARLGKMAAVVAHEVKNPLAGIRGAIEIIGEELARTGGESHEIVPEILDRIAGLNRSVEDLLVFARPLQPHGSQVDVQALVRSCVEVLSRDPLFADVTVRIEGEAVELVADPELLAHVLQNGLLNAAQAMEGRGRIRVSVSSEDRHCRIDVSDDGPGIPLDTLPQIFEPFYTTKSRGTGLGLSIARRMVAAHGGEIELRSQAGHGATLSIRLPLDALPR